MSEKQKPVNIIKSHPTSSDIHNNDKKKRLRSLFRRTGQQNSGFLDQIESIGTMRVGLNPNQFTVRKTLRNNRNNKTTSKSGLSMFAIISSVLAMLAIIYLVVLLRISSLSSKKQQVLKGGSGRSINSGVGGGKPSSSTTTIGEKLTMTRERPATCQFRRYPPRRYYGLPKQTTKASLPDFLQQEYIYGQLPQLLKLPAHPLSPTQKLCVDQNEWYHKDPSVELPFADGTNPSIFKLPEDWSIDHQSLLPPDAKYLMTICMTNSQCAWKDSEQEINDYKLSQQSKPSTVRTLLLVLNEQLETLQEFTIYMIMDQPDLGKKKKFKKDEQKLWSLDDARLFTYQQELWVSYREGKLMGYENQVLNKVHLIPNNDNQKIQGVKLYSSEMELLCCGRNMALLDDGSTTLQALTWVDPITVVNVPMTKQQQQENAKNNRRQLQQVFGNVLPNNDGKVTKRLQSSTTALLDAPHSHHPHRRLKQDDDETKKSDFHGTNGMMVHLPETNEYLGIGHFHRPPERDFNNPYARFGHHYTHAFFTIPDHPPYRLQRLSAELVLPSHAYSNDADIIQFWSGLELIDDSKTLLLAYGINDCEAAATYVDLSTVDDLLRDVPEGMEVVDLMMPLPDD